MKKIITTLGFLTFVTCAIGQAPAPIQIVTDPKLLEQALDQAVKEAERIALQEAQKELQQLQADAMSKVSESLKASGVLKGIVDKNLSLIKKSQKASQEISAYKLPSYAKNKANKDILKLAERSAELNKRAKTIMQDDGFKGTDAQRLLLLNEIEKEQKEIQEEISSLRFFYRNM